MRILINYSKDDDEKSVSVLFYTTTYLTFSFFCPHSAVALFTYLFYLQRYVFLLRFSVFRRINQSTLRNQRAQSVSTAVIFITRSGKFREVLQRITQRNNKNRRKNRQGKQENMDTEVR